VTECTRVKTQTNIPKNIVEVQEFLESKNMLSSKGESMFAVNNI